MRSPTPSDIITSLQVCRQKMHHMRTVLLIEDNHDDQILVRRALKSSAGAVKLEVLGDGEEAVQLIKRLDAGLDLHLSLILLDLKLPKIGGLDLIPLIRTCRTTTATPIVVFSSSDEPQDIQEAYARGANSYVQKPIDYDQYMRVLTEVVEYWLAISMLPLPVRRH